jgi:hypothetical protein
MQGGHRRKNGGVSPVGCQLFSERFCHAFSLPAFRDGTIQRRRVNGGTVVPSKQIIMAAPRRHDLRRFWQGAMVNILPAAPAGRTATTLRGDVGYLRTP